MDRQPGAVRIMKTNRTRLALLFLIGLALLPVPAAADDGVPRVIHVTARSFAFEPEIVHVRQGERVIIELESLDATHGIYLDGYDLSVEAEPGRPAQLSFTADRAGSFRFRCSVACGNLHPFMIGQLKVGPNTRFWQAVAALALVTLGAVWFFGKRNGTSEQPPL